MRTITLGGLVTLLLASALGCEDNAVSRAARDSAVTFLNGVLSEGVDQVFAGA